MNTSSSPASSKKTVGDWLKTASRSLAKAGIPSAHLDNLILLEHCLGKDRAYLLAHPEFPIASRSLAKLNKFLIRRAKHEPIAYLTGKSEFYGREFRVSKYVLEPRPESEAMIELLKQLVSSEQWRVDRKAAIADIGTGSGCLAITAKLEIPEARVFATDIDPKCLKIARQNARKFSAKIDFLQGDLLEPLYPIHYPLSTILLANLPYVPDRFRLNPAAMNEPKIAIFGGKDGLNIYRRLFDQLKELDWQPRFILTESLPPQHQKLAKIASASGYKLVKTQDFVQLYKGV